MGRPRYPVTMCLLTDVEPKASWVKTNPDCPNAANHELHPRGYLAHAAWADKRLKTHTTSRCPDCGLWTIGAKK